MNKTVRYIIGCLGICFLSLFGIQAGIDQMKEKESIQVMAALRDSSQTQQTSLIPSITPKPTLSVSNKPIKTAKPKHTKKPVSLPTPKPKIGWHKTAKGNKYYILKSGKRAKGYKKIDGYYYFFNRSGLMQKKVWKYVKIDGRKYKLYFGKNGKQKQDVSKLIGEQRHYQIEVNLKQNLVIVYAKDGKNGYIIPVKAMICSGGMPGHRTRTGSFTNLSQTGRWHYLRYNSIGQYCTRFSGPYLFHSVVYTRYGDHYSLVKKEYNKLGKSASHGCVRLQVADAKWIYDRAYRCSANVFYSKKQSPLQKPKKQKIGKTKSGKYYDPTDSNR